MFSMATYNTLSSSEAQVPDAELESLHVRLAQVLAYAGINQAELARRVGMSPGFLSDVIRGVKRPGAELLLALRKSCGVSIDWLLSGEGTMIGGAGIRHDLFRAIRLQVAVARAAVIGSDPTARALMLLIREGQLNAAAGDPAFKTLLDKLAPEDADLDLAIELYNGHQWATDPVAQRRNLLAAATAHFEARKPIDRVAAVTGAGMSAAVVQVNTGKGQRVAGRDINERGRRKP
jgi:transcriptional regulator with XRE-family HTH domain